MCPALNKTLHIVLLVQNQRTKQLLKHKVNGVDKVNSENTEFPLDFPLDLFYRATTKHKYVVVIVGNSEPLFFRFNMILLYCCESSGKH